MNNAEIEIGCTIDHQYLLKEKIGRGSFADVFKVKCLLDGMDYGMKIRFWGKVNDQLHEVGILEEIEKNMKKLPHKDLFVRKLAVLGIGSRTSADIRLCIVFPLLGCDLQRCIFHENFLFFHPHVLEKLLAQILQGVDYLHKHGIIHTDLKPDNIMCETHLVWNSLHQQKAISICKPFNIKIIDLGSAVHFRNNNPVRGIISAVAYRAPEVILERTFQSLSDMWSLGCCFYALYAGRLLFSEKDESKQIQNYTNAIGNPPHFMRETRYEILKSGKLRDHIQLGSVDGDLGYSHEGKDGRVDRHLINFLRDLLRWDPKRRLTATAALTHPFFHKNSTDETNEAVKIIG